MIDTIVLLLTENEFQITNPDKFIPNAAPFLSQNSYHLPGITCKQNPTRKELRNGIYKPRLTLSYRASISGFLEVILRIEFSVPKLFFGNNFEELQYKNFLPVVEKLVSILQRMGISTTVQNIERAQVSAIHYSKNIPLTDGATPYHFIKKIREANIKLSLDTNQTDYRNEGHSFRWHCNSYEVIFYDKIKDLQKAKTSNKRCIEKDSDMQLHLFPELRKLRKFEVLRMEVRLNKRKKIKQLFEKLKIKNNLTFKKLFKPAIAKKVLLHYLDELESKRPTLLDYTRLHGVSSGAGARPFLADLIFNNPGLSPKKILQLFGLKCALDVMNPRELRALFGNCNSQTWYQIMADAKEINLPTIPSPFEIVRTCVKKFKPLRFKKTHMKIPGF